MSTSGTAPRDDDPSRVAEANADSDAPEIAAAEAPQTPIAVPVLSRANQPELELPENLAILPSRDSVLYPGMLLPVQASDEQWVLLLSDAVSNRQPIGIALLKEPSADTTTFSNLQQIGTAANIVRLLKLPDGSLQVLLQGIARIRLAQQPSQTTPYFRCDVEPLTSDLTEPSMQVEGLVKNLQALFQRAVQLSPVLPDEMAIAAANVDDPGRLADFVAASIDIEVAQRQEILQELDPIPRAHRVTELLTRELEVLEIGSKIQSQIRDSMEKTQREFYLRQQLEAIRKELGETDPEQASLTDLRERLSSMQLPREARAEADRELNRLGSIPVASPEHSMVRTYLEWIADLPWTTVTQDDLDLHHAKRVLDEDHFDLSRVKDRILEYLAVMRLRADRDAAAATPLPPPTSMEGEASHVTSRDGARADPAARDAAPQPSQPGDGSSPGLPRLQPGDGSSPTQELFKPGDGASPGRQPSQPGEGSSPGLQPFQPGDGSSPTPELFKPGDGASPGRQPLLPGDGSNPAPQPSQPGDGSSPALAVRVATVRGPILCLVGPPGVGKTSLGQSIARALGRKFVHMSLGGVRDEAEIRGHRRTYIGALPGRIIQELRRAGSRNPVFILDELDKLGNDWRGDPSSALLEVLDPAQNADFRDHYLDIPFDLSNVLFIATANVMDTVPPALRDRLEVIDIPGYTEEDKLQIARRYLVPRQLTENGLSQRQVRISDGALRRIIREYTREAGVRNLEREIASVARKTARAIVMGETSSLTVTNRQIVELLGPPRFQQEVATREDEVGVATGLAYTPTGGEVLFIEARVVPGKGNLVLTGQLGDVMKESAQAALTYARARGRALGLGSDDPLGNKDVHVHVPAGAVPKDGPSAGITMATSIISALTRRPVDHTLAMTGEITLRGRVLPIGGLKEKVLAASRAGITRVIAPRDNRRDLEEIPAHVRKQITFTFVVHMDEVLNAALKREIRPERAEVLRKPVRRTGRRREEGVAAAPRSD